MNARVCLSILLSLSILVGCSKEEVDQHKATVSTSEQPPCESKDAGPRGGRKYTPMPVELLTAPKLGTVSCALLLDTLEKALTARDWNEALRAYRQMCDDFAEETRLRLQAAIQLVEGLMMLDPPRVEEAARILAENATPEANLRLPAGLAEQWAWLSLVVHVRTADRRMLADAAAYRTWRNALGDLIAKSPRVPRHTAFLFDALDSVMGRIGKGEPTVIDRLEAILVDMQCDLASPRFIVPIQQRRVRLLSHAERHDEALFEARVLLSVSSLDDIVLAQAMEQTVAVLQAAGQGADETAGFLSFQQRGPEGKDGLLKTADDLTNPLGQMRRTFPYLDEKLSAMIEAMASPPSGKAAVGYAMLLAGRAGEVSGWFDRIVQPETCPPDQDLIAVLNCLCAAKAYTDGHALGCCRALCDIMVGTGAGSLTAPSWRYHSARLLDERIAMIQRLLGQGQLLVAISMCRHAANDSKKPKQCQTAIELAFEACESLAAEEIDAEPLTLYRAFGQGLTNPKARVLRAKLAANQYIAAGDILAALTELEQLEPIWAQAGKDPEMLLLRASCLVRLGHSEEAFPLVKEVTGRGNVTQSVAARARLLLSAIYLQQGKPVEARVVLRQLVDQHPDSQYATRANAILERL